MDAPQEVVGEFNRGGLFEGSDTHALRIECAEHVIDRAVLATGVECLQDDEDGLLVLSIEDSLLAPELESS
jgi:hypothetical protein